MVVLLRHTHVDMREGIGHLAPGNCAEEETFPPAALSRPSGSEKRSVLTALRSERSGLARIAVASTLASLRSVARRLSNT
jgi:hypothetical protein